MSPFPLEMAKSFVRSWHGSSSVGRSGSGSARVHSTLQPWREAPTRPQERPPFPKEKRSKTLDAADNKISSEKWRAHGSGTDPSPRE